MSRDHSMSWFPQHREAASLEKLFGLAGNIASGMTWDWFSMNLDEFGTLFGDDETLGPIDVRIKCLKQVPLWILSWLRDYGVSLSSKNPSYGEFNYIPKAGTFGKGA